MRLRLATFAVAQKIQPGVFSPEFGGIRIYVEEATPDRRVLTRLFVSDRSQEEGERLTVAPRGWLEIDEAAGRLWLRLDDAGHPPRPGRPPEVRHLVGDRPGPAPGGRSPPGDPAAAPPGAAPSGDAPDGDRSEEERLRAPDRPGGDPEEVLHSGRLPSLRPRRPAARDRHAARRTGGRIRGLRRHRPRLLRSPRRGRGARRGRESLPGARDVVPEPPPSPPRPPRPRARPA